MFVSDLRSILRAFVKRGESSYTPAELDYALQGALHDLDLTGRTNRTTGTVNATAGNPEVDVSSITGLNPDRVVRVELGFTDQGTWSAASVSYSKNDLVTNDAKFYVATEDHTSAAGNEPATEGGRGKWALRKWKRGDRVQVVTYDTVARQLGDDDDPLLEDVNRYVREDVDGRGKPRMVGILTKSLWYLKPVPDIAYPVVVIQDNPIDEWVAGSDDPEIDLPHAALLPVAQLGASWRLETNHPSAANWQAMWNETKQRIRGRLIVDAGIGVLDEREYLDHTDVRPTRRL